MHSCGSVEDYAAEEGRQRWGIRACLSARTEREDRMRGADARIGAEEQVLVFRS